MSDKGWSVIVWGICLLTFVGCSSSANKTLSAFYNSRIEFPDLFECRILAKDTTITSDKLQQKSLLIIYHDSSSCSSCAVRNMFLWDDLLDSLPVTPIFVFAPSYKDLTKLKKELIIHPSTHLIWIDSQHSFRKINPTIPSESRYHCFLLDSNRKVKLIGDPRYNQQLFELYKNVLSRSL